MANNPPLTLPQRLSLFLRASMARLAGKSDEPSRPHEQQNSARPSQRRQAQSFHGLSRLTVLVVEDIEETRKTICTMLTALDHKFIEAIDGAQAIALAETHRPDIIMMDLSLPGMDGRKAARKLRQHHNSELASIPIIAMTAHLPQNHENEQKDGMTACLVKPVNPSTLARTLQTSMVADAFIASDLPDPEQEEQQPLFDPSILCQDLAQLGEEQVDRQIRIFLDEAPGLSKAIHDTDDARQISQKAEELKGLAINLGLLRLAQTARNIECGSSPLGLDRVIKASVRELQRHHKTTEARL